MRTKPRFPLRSLVAAAALGAVLAMPGTAQAWWRGGLSFGFAPFAPYPYFYAPPPPVYYAPPAYYPPPAAGQACYAGPYVCPLANASPRGAPCSCPTNESGRAGGRVG